MTENTQKIKDKIWIEKYRPDDIKDVIMIEDIKKVLIERPNDNYLFVSSTPGLGKTTITKIISKDNDVLWINASEENSVNTIRGKLISFCETISVSQKQKTVILDEADNLSLSRDGTAGAQDILRGVIEKYTNVNFILTANYIERFIEPLKNRLKVIDFDKIYQENKKEMFQKIGMYLVSILKENNIEFKKDDIKKLIIENYPSVRKMVNELQLNIKDNKFALNASINDLYDEILEFTFKKDWENTRERVEYLVNADYFYNYFWKKLKTLNLDTNVKAKITILLGEYMNMSKNTINKNIILMGFLTKVMELI